MRSRGFAAFTFLAVLGVVGPILGVALLATRIGETPLVVEPDTVAEETFVVTRQIVDEQVVEVALSGSAPAVLRAGAGSGGGVVTRVFVGAGDAVGDGDAVIAVDGVAILGAATEEPFHREIGPNSTGPDVLALQDWLVATGYLEPANVDGTFGSATRVAVRALHTDRGLTGTRATFRPSDVIWLPQATVDVAEVTVEAGTTAPAEGAAVLTTERVFDRAVVRLPSGFPGSFEGSWDLIVGDEVVGEVVDDVIPPGSVPQIVESSLGASAGAAGASDESEAGDVTLSALVRRQAPLERNVVPVGSVLSFPTPDDELRATECLYVQGSDGFVPFETAIVGGDFGVLYIEPAPDGTRPILANPIDFLDDPSCT